MNQTRENIQEQRWHTLIAPLQALSLVLLIILAEYSARHFIAPWLPTIGAWRVNDMLVSALCYLSLLLLTAPSGKRHVRVLWQSLQEIAATVRRSSTLTGASLLIGTGWLSWLDRWLWGSILLPVWNGPSNQLILFERAGPFLRVISLLLVNGLLVPIAEERLWRGLIQPRLAHWIGLLPGLTLTAFLFSLKHAIVDASLGRLLTLFIFGLIAGFLAISNSWKSSALAHSLANTLATVILLFTTGGNV